MATLDQAENATGAAWRQDEAAVSQAFQSATDKDRDIMASTEAELADMEAKAAATPATRKHSDQEDRTLPPRTIQTLPKDGAL